MTVPTPRQHLHTALDAYEPAVAACARKALRKLRTLVPGALELVYDNDHALAIGFAATERASHAVVSIALYPRWVTLFFLYGATLPDPTRRLVGSGKRVHRVVLESAAVLDEPEIRALVGHAVERAPHPFDPRQKRRTIIKAIATRWRPRRPAAKTRR